MTARWQRTADGEVMLTSLSVAGSEWIGQPCRPVGLSVDADVGVSLRDVTGRVLDDGMGVRLEGRLHGTALRAVLTWRAYEHASVLGCETGVINGGDEPVTVRDPASLWLRIGLPEGSRLGMLRGGAWDAAMPPLGYTLQMIDLPDPSGSSTIAVADDGRSSGTHVPWFALFGPTGGLASGLVWSGRWRLNSRLAGRVGTLAIGLSDFERVLAPGERLDVPTVILCGFRGELDDAAAALHEWARRYHTPPAPADWPWVQYNHWYAYFGDIDEARLLEEARLAAAAGCEVFVIDDGWFRGRRPDSYVAGWGDWREDRGKFPRGLKAFGDEIQRLGMRFGLWVEPERVDLAGELATRRPKWVAQRNGQPIARGWGDDTAAHLCLGVPEVQEWMVGEMVRVVQEYGVDWLKWDYNMGYGLGCNRPDHGHQVGDGHVAHTIGLYRVLENLVRACPKLVIENCASGGHRVDLGMLRHTHTQWLSDYTHRAASCRHHAQGAGYFLPLPYLNTWVLDRRGRYEYRSRMGGAFGVSARLGRWSDEERQELARAISEYKRLRPLLAGRRYLLTGPWHQGWDVWQLGNPADGRFAVLAFRDADRTEEVRVRLRGLDGRTLYRLEWSDAVGNPQASGQELMDDGLAIRLPTPAASVIVWGSLLEAR